MPWLLRDGDVLAALEQPSKGWQRSLCGAVLVSRPAVVQTMTRRAAADLDTAWCVPTALRDGRAGLEVRKISVLRARRLSHPRVRAGALIVAPLGTFERWRLQVGDRLEVR